MLGRDPWAQRDQLMRDVSFIADVAVLPRWMRVSQALDYVAGVHPRFDRAKAEALLAQKRRSSVRPANDPGIISGHGNATSICWFWSRPLTRKIAGAGRADAWARHPVSQAVLRFSTQRLLRSQPHNCRLNASGGRVAANPDGLNVHRPWTNCVELQHGRIRIALYGSEAGVNPDQLAAARALKPMYERQVFGRSILLFDRGVNKNIDRQQLASLGEVRTPSIADLFVAVLGNQAGMAQGATR